VGITNNQLGDLVLLHVAELLDVLSDFHNPVF
jgi:hypothetical protein